VPGNGLAKIFYFLEEVYAHPKPIKPMSITQNELAQVIKNHSLNLSTFIKENLRLARYYHSPKSQAHASLLHENGSNTWSNLK